MEMVEGIPTDKDELVRVGEIRDGQVKAAIRAGIAEAGRQLTRGEKGSVEAHVDLSLDLFTTGPTLALRT